MKTQVTISNPNPYKSKNTEAQMVSYRVTGSPEAVAIFIADQKAQDVDSKDDKGNPLFHVLASNASKYGVTSVIERATNANGETYWFKDNAEEKELQALMDGADDITKLAFAQQKIAEMKAFAKVLAQNKARNIATLQARRASGEVVPEASADVPAEDLDSL